MTSFNQLGDPVCEVCPPPVECLCEHHGAAYAERPEGGTVVSRDVNYDLLADGATIVQQSITITERCCLAVTTATLTRDYIDPTAFEIERPLGDIRTNQEDAVDTGELRLHHHGAWEVLDPGTYTYYLVNRSGSSSNIYAAWLKIIASDCEG